MNTQIFRPNNRIINELFRAGQLIFAPEELFIACSAANPRETFMALSYSEMVLNGIVKLKSFIL